MARIRTIKPEFWRHEELSALPADTHMLAAALLNYADDEGYFNANPKLVQAECCPLRELSVSVHDSLNHLVEIGYIRVGTGADGKRYGQVVTFDEHQRVNRPQPSKIKAVGIVWDEAVTNHTQVSERASPEWNREQGTGNGKEHESLSARADAERYAEAFETLWSRWRPFEMPKGSKKEARTEWDRHVRKPRVDPQEAVRAGAAYCDECGRLRSKTKHVARWIKTHGWESQAEPPARAGPVNLDNLDDATERRRYLDGLKEDRIEEERRQREIFGS